MKSRLLHGLPRRAFLLLMLAGAAFIAVNSGEYLDLEAMPLFVLEKLPLRFEALYLTTLRVHVVSALLSFPLCLALMTQTVQRRRRLHRWMGRLTGVIVLLALVPSGFALAFHARGGWLGSLGFWLTGGIVAAAMVLGVRAARRGELKRHAHAMRHVVAQMCVAVTSRALMLALDAGGVEPELGYVVALWVPVLGHALWVESLSAGVVRTFARGVVAWWEGASHEGSRLAGLRGRAVVRAVVRDGR
ncbi:MAG TPA: DUF2306 domain-containing protein [Polyangiaceae bacterium]|nr:DUF2306 domain-containing protein [Polyangiaceae bacterium]